MGVLNVKLVLAGKDTREFGITTGQTVADVFEIAQEEMNGEIRLNDRPAKPETKIMKNNSIIQAVPRISGA